MNKDWIVRLYLQLQQRNIIKPVDDWNSTVLFPKECFFFPFPVFFITEVLHLLFNSRFGLDGASD